MTWDVEHFFKRFLAIEISLLRILISSVPPFEIGLFGLLVFNFLSSLYIKHSCKLPFIFFCLPVCLLEFCYVSLAYTRLGCVDLAV